VQEAPQLDLDVPRDAGDLIATTLALFARHAMLFLSVTLVIVAPVTILVTGVWAGALTDGPDADVATAPAVTNAVLASLMPVLVTALHVMVVRDLGEGRVPSIGQALRSAAPRFPHAIAAILVYTVLLVGGSILFVIPGIWVFVAGYFATEAAVMERRGPLSAFRRSTELVEDRWWRTAGTLVLGSVLLGIVFVPVGLAIDGVDSGVAYVLLYTLAQVLHMSLSALFGTLMYFSLRARKEHPFDSGPATVFLPPIPGDRSPVDR
jgi:uncharacterized membrane protein